MQLPSHCGTKNVISSKRGNQFLMCLNNNYQCISALETCRRHVPTLWCGFVWGQWKITGGNGAMIMHCCRIVNGIKNKKHKKQPWGNVECFAFGGATVRFASLETSFHAANHTNPPPPSYEGLPRCPKDKNRSPLHGEKLLMIK